MCDAARGLPALPWSVLPSLAVASALLRGGRRTVLSTVATWDRLALAAPGPAAQRRRPVRGFGGLAPRQHCCGAAGWSAAVARPGRAVGIPPGLIQVLRFWFGDECFDRPAQLDDAEYLRVRAKRWYRGGPSVDLAAAGFLPLLRAERAAALAERPPATPAGEVAELTALGRVVLFDQIPRNAARGTPEAFQQDELASGLSEALLAAGFGVRCRAAEALALAQPLAHAEVPPDGARAEAAIALLRAAASRFPLTVGQRLLRAAGAHEGHLRVLQRFGRYPHRNVVLGRESTAEELAWLDSPECPGWAKSQLPRPLAHGRSGEV